MPQREGSEPVVLGMRTRLKPDGPTLLMLSTAASISPYKVTEGMAAGAVCAPASAHKALKAAPPMRVLFIFLSPVLDLYG
jgi:hypothetical protein